MQKQKRIWFCPKCGRELVSRKVQKIQCRGCGKRFSPFLKTRSFDLSVDLDDADSMIEHPSQPLGP